jgi:hypothetical protein
LNYHTLIIWEDFIVMIPHMQTVYLEQVHPLHYFSILPFSSPPFSNSVKHEFSC